MTAPLHLFGLPAREMVRNTWIATLGALVFSADFTAAGLWRVGISTARHGSAERLDALAVGHGPSLEIAERDAERRLRQREIDCRDARAAMRGMRREVLCG